MSNKKSENAYKTIGEIAKDLNLVDKKNGKLQTHTIRYWQTQFKQIKPTIRAGNRRYYSSENIKMLKYIKFLLKDRGLTISGVKKLLDHTKTHSIDDNADLGIYKRNLSGTKKIKDKVKNIYKIINELKKLNNG